MSSQSQTSQALLSLWGHIVLTHTLWQVLLNRDILKQSMTKKNIYDIKAIKKYKNVQSWKTLFEMSNVSMTVFVHEQSLYNGLEMIGVYSLMSFAVV